MLTRADDFGASPGTNEAILGAARAGFVKNVGIMAPAPWVEKNLTDLRDLGGMVCLGLHATLNSEWSDLRWGPVAEAASVPGLVRPDGTFHANTDRTHLHGDTEEGVREIRAQLEKLRALGLDVRYLDCHMCFNWHPDWDRAMGELATEEGLVYEAHGMLPALPLAMEKSAFPTPSKVLQYMETERINTALWVFHPAIRDAVSEQFFKDPEDPGTTVAQARHKEYRFLTDPGSIQPFLSSRELLLIRYDELEEQPDPEVSFFLEAK